MKDGLTGVIENGLYKDEGTVNKVDGPDRDMKRTSPRGEGESAK